ncbi:HPF/RaiA family ribosome-associated protein [Actinomadura macrotermitis]|uniref:Uncharacterized protein n=1 Tax=Actinomadura macrotermitis TaxID=2585200 RepID=A0A7K0BLG4_9ACTN|nr:HPF/RaiA family ribosome-associated protein [Actinomadura macrotermitis]MQY02023.1 hypothetical protein [Actinomadura macrotermitis]
MNTIDRTLPAIGFQTSGQVSDAEREVAERAVRSALDGAQGEITSVRVTLSKVTGADLPRPALAQAVVELAGRRLRAQAAAPDLTEAIDLLRDRLAVRAA